LEDEVIYKYGMLKYIMIDNGNEWMKEFDDMCHNYGMTPQFIAPTWRQCNGMVEHLIKTMKQGLTVMATSNIQC
jgi:hypothetical protein